MSLPAGSAGSNMHESGPAPSGCRLRPAVRLPPGRPRPAPPPRPPPGPTPPYGASRRPGSYVRRSPGTIAADSGQIRSGQSRGGYPCPDPTPPTPPRNGGTSCTRSTSSSICRNSFAIWCRFMSVARCPMSPSASVARSGTVSRVRACLRMSRIAAWSLLNDSVDLDARVISIPRSCSPGSPCAPRRPAWETAPPGPPRTVPGAPDVPPGSASMAASSSSASTSNSPVEATRAGSLAEAPSSSSLSRRCSTPRTGSPNCAFRQTFRCSRKEPIT